MKTWTAQTRDGAAPVLIPEAFSVWALVFGPFWLAFHGVWLFAAIGLAVDVAAEIWAPWWCGLGLAWLYGLFGQDIRRFALELRGFTVVHVIAARDFDAALGRLLAGRPDLLTHDLLMEAAQ